MKHRLLIALALATVALAAASAQAQDAPPIARYIPTAPDARHIFVMDSAHILSDATIRSLQDSAQALQTETGADIAWVTLPTLGGRAIEEATVYLGRTWKVGSAGEPGDELRNRGLVILYVPDKSKTAGSNFRIEVGQGLQGTIIDSKSRAISAAMRDDLRAKRYDAGYARGWAAAAALVRTDVASRGANRVVPVQPPVSRQDKASGRGVRVFIVLIGVGLVAFIVVIAKVASRPKRAGGGGMDGMAAAMMLASLLTDDDRRRGRSDDDSSWSGSDSSDSGSSSDSGGDFGGGGGFDGGGSSDSI